MGDILVAIDFQETSSECSEPEIESSCRISNATVSTSNSVNLEEGEIELKPITDYKSNEIKQTRSNISSSHRNAQNDGIKQFNRHNRYNRQGSHDKWKLHKQKHPLAQVRVCGDSMGCSLLQCQSDYCSTRCLVNQLCRKPSSCNNRKCNRIHMTVHDGIYNLANSAMALICNADCKISYCKKSHVSFSDTVRVILDRNGSNMKLSHNYPHGRCQRSTNSSKYRYKF